jgi:hypothetical protein
MPFTNDREKPLMALYMVRAKPKEGKDLSALRKEMNSGKIASLEPFGEALQFSLENARLDQEGEYAIWVEEDHCSPPLAIERECVYLTGILKTFESN